MARSKVAKKENRDKKRHREQYDKAPETITASVRNRVSIPTIIPEATCSNCKTNLGEGGQDNFDANGYPVLRSIVQTGQAARANTSVVSRAKEAPFRLLDLPAEVRNTIYEFAMSTPTDVCIPDGLLRPSEDLPGTSNVLRECRRDLICLPCQLHNLLGTNQLGLSRANKQLHDETALIPYTVTTFSVHNLYYLQAFLQIIGASGRKALSSLRFIWKLPEEEAHALQMYTNVYETYTMLLECCCLKELVIDVDVVNLLTWRGNGNPRTAMLNYLYEIRSIELIYGLRGLRHIRI